MAITPPVQAPMTPALLYRYADVSLRNVERKAIKKFGIGGAGVWYTWDCRPNNSSTGSCTFVMIFITGKSCGGKIIIRDQGAGISYKFKRVICRD